MIFEGETTEYDFHTKVIRDGFDGKTCWVHARAGVIPGDPSVAVLTMQKLQLSGSDVFYPLNEIHSDDGGNTWSEPVELTESFGRDNHGDGVESVISDFTPQYHEKTNRILGTGHSVWYKNNHVMPAPRKRDVTYSVYDHLAKSWSKWSTVEFPDPKLFFDVGAGCTQRYDLPTGDILLPIYFRRDSARSSISVMKCAFDGNVLEYLEHGDEITIPVERGLGEPSITCVDGEFFLTIRNDEKGYVTKSSDGLHFSDPKPWTFDDGGDLGNYNTQQHWITHNDKLYLVYTRRGLDNDHVFRHRAPLVMAEVDKESLCVIRGTEQVMIPERGARLGNFGVTHVSENEDWIVVSEWMQSKAPDPCDGTVCQRYGSNNAIFICKILWR